MCSKGTRPYAEIVEMEIFLGIDGGGTKTCCAVGDRISVLAQASSGGSNVVRVGEDRARSALHSAIQEACAAAKASPTDVKRACIGVAGAGRPEIRDVVKKLAAEILSCEIDVVGDMEIAMQAAFGRGPGLIVIAGTGSIAYGRNAAGETARAGGRGFAISDEGSGHWIGRTATASALRAVDDGGNPGLLTEILKALKLETVDQLVLAGNATPPPDFSSLMPVVVRAAESGDALAREVLIRAGNELAALGSTILRRLFRNEDAVRTAMCGGVFVNSALVRDTFSSSLRGVNSKVEILPDVAQPVEGALQLARAGGKPKSAQSGVIAP